MASKMGHGPRQRNGAMKDKAQGSSKKKKRKKQERAK